jgi:hypothetical protein
MHRILELQDAEPMTVEATRWSGLSLSGCSGFSGVSLIGCGS